MRPRTAPKSSTVADVSAEQIALWRTEIQIDQLLAA
jgi:hypothetical protein